MMLSGLFAIVQSWIPTVGAALATNAFKVTIPLALAAAATLALRKASSAKRHAIWCAALVGTLLLPVLTSAVPEWTLPILPAPRGIATTPAPSRVLPHRARIVATSPEPAPARAVTGITVSAPSPAPAAPRPFPSWPLLLLGVWIAGAALILVRVAIGQFVLVRLAHAARPIRGAAWTALAERAAEEAGLDRPFELLESDRIGVPATFGALKPVVLLPVAAREWPGERLSAVLVHELTHAARYDCFTQLLAQIACALYWYHPGVWWAERRMRIERESACDDRVIAGCVSASDYADHLIEVLREARKAGLPAFGAVAFARRSSLEGRLLALLDPLRDRRSPSRRIAWSAGLTSAALLLVLAGARLGTASAEDNQDRSRASVYGALKTGAPERDPNPSEVVLAPESEGDLESRWAWAVQGSSRQAPHGGMWIGYELNDVRAGGGHGLLSDSEGIGLALLNGHSTGPTLLQVLSRRGDLVSGAPSPDGIALLFHVTRGGVVDRVRAQSFSLAAQLGGQPLYWLGRAGDAQSLAWLEQLERRVSGDSARRALLAAVSYHGDSQSVNSWLGDVAQSSDRDGLRAEAAQGLGRHPTPDAIRVLDKLAREDRSADVRRSAIEALGQVDDGAAASSLFDIARAHENAPDRARERAETPGQMAAAAEAYAQQIATLTESADGLAAQAEASAQVADEMTKTQCVTKTECRAKTECSTKSECSTKCSTKDKKTECKVESAETPEAPGVPEVRPGAGVEIPDSPPPPPPGPDASEDVQARVNSVETLGELPEMEALPRLAQLARTDANADVRHAATEAVAQIGSDGALAVLEDLALHAPDPAVQKMAMEAVTDYPPERQLPVVTTIARSHPRAEMRRQAVDQMSDLNPEQTVSILEEIVQVDADVHVKVEGVDALSDISTPAGTRALERIARSSNLPAHVRREALEALGKEDPSQVMPIVEDILQDKQPSP